MPNVVRKGDTNTVGGAVMIGASTVFAEGSEVALPNAPVTPHPCCGFPGCNSHCNATTTGGSSTVFAEGQPIITSDDFDSCGDKRNTFAPTVFIGK